MDTLLDGFNNLNVTNSDVQIIDQPSTSINKKKIPKKRTTKTITTFPKSNSRNKNNTLLTTKKDHKKECNRLLGVAKICERDMDWSTSLEFFQSAINMLYEMKTTTNDDIQDLIIATENKIDKLTTKVNRQQAKNQEQQSKVSTAKSVVQPSVYSWNTRPDTDEASLPGNFTIPNEHYLKLFPHQRRGVEWMWSLYRDVSGGILADDMGLGKTVQVVTLLRGMCANVDHRVGLVVAPVSVVPQWKKEFTFWAPELKVIVIHGMSSKQKTEAMASVLASGGIIITTYGQIRSQQDFFAAAQSSNEFQTAKTLAIKYAKKEHGGDIEYKKLLGKRAKKRLKRFQYACVVLDEGHIIKNHTTLISMAVRTLPTRQRLLLTGTPIQNHLKEIWSLFDWVTDGHLLGSLKEFHRNIEVKIELANQKGAMRRDKIAGRVASERLASIIKPLMLRRTKDEVKADKEEQPEVKRNDKNKFILGTKLDIAVWIPLDKGVQRELYYDLLQSKMVKAVLNMEKKPLVAIGKLNKVCQHPSLIIQKENKNKINIDEDDLHMSSFSSSSEPKTIDWLSKYPKIKSFRASSKLCFLMKLVLSLKDHGGHRTLIFTQTKLFLTIIEENLAKIGISYLRIDGETPLKTRQTLVDEFNMNPNIDVFLLTIGVGGVGLTLTGADRVIISDPNWNPKNQIKPEEWFGLDEYIDLVKKTGITPWFTLA